MKGTLRTNRSSSNSKNSMIFDGHLDRFNIAHRRPKPRRRSLKGLSTTPNNRIPLNVQLLRLPLSHCLTLLLYCLGLMTFRDGTCGIYRNPCNGVGCFATAFSPSKTYPSSLFCPHLSHTKLFGNRRRKQRVLRTTFNNGNGGSAAPMLSTRSVLSLMRLSSSSSSSALSMSVSSSSDSNTKRAVVTAVGKVLRQTMVLDGAEWMSVRTKLLSQQQPKDDSLPSFARTKFGVCTAVTGSVDGQRIVGLQVMVDGDNGPSSVALDQDASILVYHDSTAVVPPKISERDALWTLLQALSLVHCVRPILTNVGGSSTATTSSGESSIFTPSAHVVIVGSSAESAVVAAKILSTCFDYQVTLVSSQKPSGLSSSIRHVTPITTMEREDENDDGDDDDDSLGFAAVLDKFDALLDTIGDEQDDNSATTTTPVVIQQLAERHGCHTYVSLQTESQRLVVQNGLLWGPGKSKEHVAQLCSDNGGTSGRALQATAARFPPPIALGATVQAMLEKGMLLSPPKDAPKQDGVSSSIYVKGWSLKDFWEYTTWPRDANSNVRFGFPGLEKSSIYDYMDDIDDDEEYDDDDLERGRTMISAPPMNPNDARRPDMFLPTKEQQEEEDNNPYVKKITGVAGLTQVVSDEMTCVLFVSAPFCRTCRYLGPQYRRLARQYNEKYSSSSGTNTASSDDGADSTDVPVSSALLQFVKAEATGTVGKELGRALGIDSVPSFILFKRGRRYGQPLSINRLPSKKLDLAIAYLQQDKAWDNDVFNDTKEGGFEGGTGQGKTSRSKLF